MKYIILFTIILFLIPIPINVSLHYSKSNYYIYFYKIDIFSKNGGLIRKIINKKKTKSKPVKKKYSNISKSKKTKSKKIKSLSVKELLIKLTNNKIKPLLCFSIEMSFSLNDASKTAISYGLINIFNPILASLFSSFFNLKKFALNINPIFKDSTHIDITLKSIITFNLVQIIYILFLIFNSRKNSEEATPS